MSRFRIGRNSTFVVLDIKICNCSKAFIKNTKMKKNLIPKRLSLNTTMSTDTALLSLFTDVLGAKKILKEPGLDLFQMQDGTVVEVYGKGSFPPEKIFENSNVVLSFRVEDIHLSVQCLLGKGAELLDQINKPCATYAYCHLKLKENLVVGLYQED